MDIAPVLEGIGEGITLLALRPGDRLAIHVPSRIGIEEIADIQAEMKRLWPEIVPAFFTDDVELTVIRSED